MAWFRRKKASDEPRNEHGHILVVDDDPETRILARTLLEHAGFRVSEAIDGVIALEKIRAGEIDLVLLDLEMPRLPGREVLARLRSDDLTRGLPVVILTGRTEKKVEELMLREGANGYVRKPIDPESFVAYVRDHVG